MPQLKLLLSLLSLMTGLLKSIQRFVQQRQIRKEIENEYKARQLESIRRASTARRTQRNDNGAVGDSRLQDDGFRRD